MKEQTPSSQEISQQKFDRILRGNFDFFMRARYVTTLPGIDAINIFQLPPKEKSPRASALGVVLIYKVNDKPATLTLSLSRNGTLSGRIPEYLHLSNEDVKKEVISIAEQVHLKFFTSVKENIDPPYNDVTEPPTSEGGTSKEQSKPLPDPKRIALLVGRKDSLFGSYNELKGFDGPVLFFFTDFLMLENREVNHALHLFPYKESIQIDEKSMELAPEDRFSAEKRLQIIDEKWGSIAGKSLSEIKRIHGYERVIHPPIDDEKWGERMNERIDKAIRRLQEKRDTK